MEFATFKPIISNSFNDSDDLENIHNLDYINDYIKGVIPSYKFNLSNSFNDS